MIFPYTKAEVAHMADRVARFTEKYYGHDFAITSKGVKWIERQIRKDLTKLIKDNFTPGIGQSLDWDEAPKNAFKPLK